MKHTLTRYVRFFGLIALAQCGVINAQSVVFYNNTQDQLTVNHDGATTTLDAQQQTVITLTNPTVTIAYTESSYWQQTTPQTYTGTVTLPDTANSAFISNLQQAPQESSAYQLGIITHPSSQPLQLTQNAQTAPAQDGETPATQQSVTVWNNHNTTVTFIATDGTTTDVSAGSVTQINVDTVSQYGRQYLSFNLKTTYSPSVSTTCSYGTTAPYTMQASSYGNVLVLSQFTLENPEQIACTQTAIMSLASSATEQTVTLSKEAAPAPKRSTKAYHVVGPSARSYYY